MAEAFSRLSPSASFQFAVSRLAANGSEEAFRFWHSLVAYRQVLTKYAFYSWADHARYFYERKIADLEAKNNLR